MIVWHRMPFIDLCRVLLVLIQSTDEIWKQWQSFSLEVIIKFLFLPSFFGRGHTLESYL